MNRIELQELAQIRINEAQLLLLNGNNDGAYYLSGYAIECALKACIAKHTQEHDFPDKQFTNSIYTHDLQKLMKLSGLEPTRIAHANNSSDFAIYWSIVTDWNEGARYKKWSQQQAHDMYEAVSHSDPNKGVLEWIKFYW
ncbi:hypothetical protein ABEY80_22020 [Priestia megaterium]